MADERKDEGGPAPEEHGRNHKSGKMFEQDANDIPQKAQPQVPEVNPPTVQPGHRDREQI